MAWVKVDSESSKMALCDDEDIYDASLSFLESLNTLEVTENRLRRTMGDSKLDEDRREELAIEVKATRDKEEKLHREELKRFQEELDLIKLSRDEQQSRVNVDLQKKRTLLKEASAEVNRLWETVRDQEVQNRRIEEMLGEEQAALHQKKVMLMEKKRHIEEVEADMNVLHDIKKELVEDLETVEEGLKELQTLCTEMEKAIRCGEQALSAMGQQEKTVTRELAVYSSQISARGDMDCICNDSTLLKVAVDRSTIAAEVEDMRAKLTTRKRLLEEKQTSNKQLLDLLLKMKDMTSGSDCLYRV